MTTLQKRTIEEAPGSKAPAGPRPKAFRPHVLAAVFRRNFSSYFSNPAGYVFITLFVFVSAWVAFWPPAFFTNNLANLAPLNQYMPYLLLFFIPAITMTTWAEERRQGTDELLLTLPARDVEVVLGKYLAALGIYTVALGFSLSHVLVLMYLGQPDPGVMLATYLGYWLMGAMLIAVGMVASLLSSNATVAFILGAVFGAGPVFAELLARPVGDLVGLLPGLGDGEGARRLIEALSVPAQFRDFGTGVVTLSGVVYFASLAAAMLYVNMVLLGRRHWAGGSAGRNRSVHALVRVAAVAVALLGLNALVGRASARWDVTAEGLYSLSQETRDLVEQIPADRPVFIQAYYSPEVPREYVQTQANLLGLLRQLDALGGDRVRLNLVAAERFSDEAREAERRFGIKPKGVFTAEGGRQASEEILLGVAFTSGPEEVVIPFVDRGLPVEYELTRSLRVVSRAQRKRVGILATDAKLLGGFDFHAMSMGQESEWQVVTELKKQYEVTNVAADADYPDNLDVLLVAQPSSLNQAQIDRLSAYVRRGKPALLLLDPLPAADPQLAASVPKQPPGGPFGGGMPPEPKGDLRPLLDLLGLDWPNDVILWEPYNPHPQLADLPPEYVFVGQGSGAREPFNPREAVTSGLQEMVLVFPGLLRGKGGLEFTPLLTTSDLGGTLRFNQVVEPGIFGPIGNIRRNRPHLPTGESYTLAARLRGTLPPAPAGGEDKDAEKKAEAKPAEAHVIVVADLDLISDQFFELRKRPAESMDFLDFDNVTFVLNCVDVLAGDDAFVSLRKRRPHHRTLLRLEAQNREFDREAQKEAKAAEEAADRALAEAQKSLDEKVEKVRANQELDERTKAIMLAQLQETENRRLRVREAQIENEKLEKVAESKAERERQVREIQNGIRVAAIALPPLPALVLGLVVFFVRSRRENRGASPNRLI